MPSRVEPFSYRLRMVSENVAVARNLLRVRVLHEQSGTRRAFIVGAGRSGTTILGQLLGEHPDVTYRLEPRIRWRAVDEGTDLWGRFWPFRGGRVLEAADASASSRQRINKLFRAEHGHHLDKSPEHIFRLGYLNAVDGHSRFVHLVRDGDEVARSIAERAQVDHPIVGRHRYNDWWGLDDAKWRFLERVAGGRGYLAEDVGQAGDDAERGLCEWLLSLNEIRLHRDALGERLLEVRYADLVTDPHGTLGRVAGFLELRADEQWQTSAARQVRRPFGVGAAPVRDFGSVRTELARARTEWQLDEAPSYR